MPLRRPTLLRRRHGLARLFGLLATLGLSAPIGTATLLFFGPPLALAAIASTTLLCWHWWRPRPTGTPLRVRAGIAPASHPPSSPRAPVRA